MRILESLFCLTAGILVMINASTRTNCENWDQFGATNLSLQKVFLLFFFLSAHPPQRRLNHLFQKFNLGFVVYTSIFQCTRVADVILPSVLCLNMKQKVLIKNLPYFIQFLLKYVPDLFTKQE